LVGEDGDAGSTGGRSASVQQKQKRSGTAHGHERADRERADRERTIRERTDRYLALPPPPPPPGPPPQSLWVEARTAEGTVYSGIRQPVLSAGVILNTRPWHQAPSAAPPPAAALMGARTRAGMA
jgi:hypothetical protein